MSEDLLVEIGTEELPYAAQAPLALALESALERALAERGLAPVSTQPFWTPRRLAVLARGIPAAEPDRNVERRGPSLAAAFDRSGRPTRAAEGFARAVGVAPSELQTLRNESGAWLVHRYVEHGHATAEVLAGLLPGVLGALPLPRRMRWGSADAAFLRPVRWIVARFGSATIGLEALGVVAGGASRGHRTHHPGPIEIEAPAAYAETLAAARVLADPGERYVAVKEMIDGVARGLDAAPAPPSDELYTEIAGMVEWPVALAARFDPRYLELPEPVLVTTLAHHQRFVPLRGTDGSLRCEFVAVVNLDSRDPEAVRNGLERVVRPRLEDAAFYYRRDRGRRLEDYCDELDGLAFGPKLGSMAVKARRLAALAARVADSVPGALPAVAARAGELAKCDLVTGMVFEFPELQGVMGGIYARANDSEEVAAAIAEQYRPAGADDSLPKTPAGMALALADRLDTLVGGFAAGLQPSAAKDPFGLRRAAFAALRIAADAAPTLDLEPLLRAAAQAYPPELGAEATLPELHVFLRERLRSLILERGDGADVAQAVLAVAPLAPGEVLARATALVAFRATPEGQALAAANKRIANILQQAVARGEQPDPEAPEPGADAEPAERDLAAAVVAAEPGLEGMLRQQDFGAALTALAALREPVDRFFDEVLVMAPEPLLRARRLALLARLRAAFLRIADVGELQPASGA